MNQVTEIIKRAMKYIIEGFAVAMAAYYIPQKVMKLDEIVTIGVSGGGSCTKTVAVSEPVPALFLQVSV